MDCFNKNNWRLLCSVLLFISSSFICCQESEYDTRNKLVYTAWPCVHKETCWYYSKYTDKQLLDDYTEIKKCSPDGKQILCPPSIIGDHFCQAVKNLNGSECKLKSDCWHYQKTERLPGYEHDIPCTYSDNKTCCAPRWTTIQSAPILSSKTNYNFPSNDDELRETIDLFNQGENVVKLDEEYRNVTLVFGNTRDGTTTLVQWLATNGENLIAKEINNNSNNYVIEDGDKIGNSTTDSKTIFPELVVNQESKIAFYDCPAFYDAQYISKELVAKYFIKKVIDHAEFVKIILVVSQSTAGRHGSYDNYLRLIENIIQFVKNIENFSDSIAIVVTKVENWSSETKNKSEITNDETLINDLGKLFASDKPLNCNKKNNKKPIASLIRTLNLKRNDTFSRIGIFRKPVESGRLIETNALLTKCKDNIQNIIQQELKFTRRINDDFAYYPISTMHKDKPNFINDLMKKISEMANSTIQGIAHQVEKHYTDLNETISRQISYFANNFNHVRGKFELGKELNLHITNGINALQKLKDIKESNNLTIIVNEIVDNLANITIPSLLNSKRNISNQVSYWEFLKPASDTNSSWIFLKPNPFKKTAYRLQELNYLMLIDVEETADKIIKNIATNIDSTAQEIGDYYETIAKMLEYHEGVYELGQVQNILNDFVPPNTTDQQYITKFLKQIDEKVAYLNIEPLAIDTIKIKITDSQYMAKYLTYLADLIYPKKINFSQEFGNPFQNITKKLKNMEIWYKFLGDLQAQYHKQFDRQPQRKFILQSDVVEFFNELKNKNINCDGIEPTELNESQLEDLNNLISSIKQSEMKLCSKLGEFLITGYNIKLSNYINNDFNLECENGVKISAIKIFAINQVIIDVDLNAKGAQLQISIIAPKWKINEKRKIILDGAPATSLQSFKTNNCEIPFGSSGEDGEPGLPGGPAGNFIGVGREFVNSNLLTISANGGDGGTGQDGQNGCPGVDGIPVILKPANIADKSNEHHNLIKIEDFSNSTTYYDYDIDRSQSNNTITVYKIHGSKGGQGGKGGNGGKGGRGGYEGSVKIINLSKFSHNIQLSTKKGNTGKGGKGGDGGIGGKNGDETIVKYIKGFTSFEIGRQPSDGRGTDGLQGYNNSNDIGIKEPEKPFIPPPIATLINQYKQYLGENLKNATYKIRNFITTFYKELDTYVDIENSNDIIAIIQEFNNLENQIYQIPVQDGLQLYQNLLNRIKEHLSQLQTNEHKKVLIYLYTTILGKIHYLKESISLTLAVDVRQYLNHITEYFQFLRDINNRNLTITTINYYEEMYTNNITKRIEKMKNFIHTEVTTKIDEIGKQIDETIKTLIEKIVESKEREPTYRQEAIVRRLELQRILISKEIINIANITQNALKIMYPKNKSSQFSINTILENEINAFKLKKINNLSFLLKEVCQKLKEYGDKFADTFEMIYNILDKLQILRRDDESTIENIIDLENNLGEILKKKETEMKNDEESTKAMLILKNINREIQISSFDFNIYDENKQNTKSLDEIFKAIEDNDNNFQKLKQYKEKIYLTIQLMLKQVRANTKNYVSRLDSELLILPDTSRWDVIKTLRDVKSYMQQLSNEYNMFVNFTCNLEKLDEAMTILINIYDYIENQEEQKTLIKFMAIIHTPTVSNIVINNYELSNTLKTLEASLTSNTILSKYKLAIKAFKQFVFPFSSHYLNSITSTFNAESENIQDLASKAIHEVDLLISIIDQYRTSIKIFDKYIHFGEFNSEGHSTSPFYVWKNQKKLKKISDLLSGKSIILQAKICESPTNKYTIKFNSIGIHFKCNNTTLQSIIDEKLRKFEVSIIHSGNSYYRYGDNFFLIPSGAKQHIQYSFEMNSKAEPRSRNRVYDKIKSGEFLLSPYTFWKMQLIPCVENVTFDELVPYTKEVDLELIGTGVYITKSNDLDLQVDKFYAEEMIKMPCGIH